MNMSNDKKRLDLRIPAELYEKLKRKALKDGVTVKEQLKRLIYDTVDDFEKSHGFPKKP